MDILVPLAVEVEAAGTALEVQRFDQLSHLRHSLRQILQDP
jgi:hypothetical protein